MADSVSLGVGSLVWVEDPGVAWIDGEVLEVNGADIKVLCTSGKMVDIKSCNLYPKDAEAPSCGVDDMTKLAYLHEPGVLHNLKSRYDINEIYTYTGNILIAVNPFRRLPHLYDGHMMAQYKGAAFGELSPHPFAVADAAYRLMIKEGVSQSILVSGESGAGKTESTKLLMRYLAYMGGRAAAEGRTVEQQVLESNPVLEAFGNAKTVRNNNSSRFGKFVEIQFDERGRISGAAIRTYLLERSRVCQVSDPERIITVSTCFVLHHQRSKRSRSDMQDMFVDVSSKLGEVATAISRIADTRLDVKKLHEEVMSTEGYEETFLSEVVIFCGKRAVS